MSEITEKEALSLARGVLAQIMSAGHNTPGPTAEDIEKAFWATDSALARAEANAGEPVGGMYGEYTPITVDTSTAHPAPQPLIRAMFETVDETIPVTGTTEAPIKRVEQNDDGSYMVVIDHWPQPSGPVEVTPETVHPSHDVRDEDISGITSDPVCQRCRISAYGPQKDRLLKPCPADEHGTNPDDEAVDRFAAAMKAKLKWEREERGRYGWNDPSVCSEEYLSRLLVEHLAKGNEGNFEDIANFCMMLHQRGAHPRVLAEALATAGKPEQVPSGWREITEEDRPPNDTDVLMGHWETWPYPRWVVECGHYGSTRGGWIHGRVTHWLPLDILPAAPAAPAAPTAGGGNA